MTRREIALQQQIAQISAKLARFKMRKHGLQKQLARLQPATDPLLILRCKLEDAVQRAEMWQDQKRDYERRLYKLAQWLGRSVSELELPDNWQTLAELPDPDCDPKGTA